MENNRQSAIELFMEQLRGLGIKVPEDKAEDLLDLMRHCKEVEEDNIIHARITAPEILSPNAEDYVNEAKEYYELYYGNN